MSDETAIWRISDDDLEVQLVVAGVVRAALTAWRINETGEHAWWWVAVDGKTIGNEVRIEDASELAAKTVGVVLSLPAALLADLGSPVPEAEALIQQMPSDRFISDQEPPEGEARELLTILGEECAEIVEAVTALVAAASRIQVRTSKALRFGLGEIQPGQPDTNAERIGREVGDLMEVVDSLLAAGVLDQAAIDAGRANKRLQLRKFMQSRAAAE